MKLEVRSLKVRSKKLEVRNKKCPYPHTHIRKYTHTRTHAHTYIHTYIHAKQYDTDQTARMRSIVCALVIQICNM